jgi:hypothetical protein
MQDYEVDRLQILADRIFQELPESLAELPESERTFALVWAVLGEVGNGGVAQFFFNSFGQYALITIEALETIGALEAATLLRTATSWFGPSGPPADIEERNDALAALEIEDAEFERIDNAWYALKDQAYQSLARYVAGRQLR